MEKRDVVIMGGGPAGYRAAIRVSQLGGKATVIEKDSFGGDLHQSGMYSLSEPYRGQLKSLI